MGRKDDHPTLKAIGVYAADTQGNGRHMPLLQQPPTQPSWTKYTNTALQETASSTPSPTNCMETNPSMHSFVLLSLNT